MQKKYVRDFLRAAYLSGDLAALHIDLQGYYYSQVPSIFKAFEGVRDFAYNLNDLDVQNIWVACTPYADRPMSVGEYRSSLCLGPDEVDSYFVTVDPKDTDLVLPKAQNDLFNSLNKEENPRKYSLNLPGTLLIDGVYIDECVVDTICGAFRYYAERGRPLNVIWVSDCSNGVNSANHDFNTLNARVQDVLRTNMPSGQVPYRFTHATSAEIVSFLTQLPRDQKAVLAANVMPPLVQ